MRSLRGAVLFLALGGVAVCEVLALDGDVVGDMARVVPDAPDERGAAPRQPGQADEIHAGFAGHTTLVARLAVAVEGIDLQPAEVDGIAGGPDDAAHPGLGQVQFEDRIGHALRVRQPAARLGLFRQVKAVAGDIGVGGVEQRQVVLVAARQVLRQVRPEGRDAVDEGFGQSDQGHALMRQGAEVHGMSAAGTAHGDGHMLAPGLGDFRIPFAEHAQPPAEVAVAVGTRRTVMSAHREVDLAPGTLQLVGDLYPRRTGADHQYRTFGQLLRVVVVGRVDLPDTLVARRDRRDHRTLERAGGGDHAVGLDGPGGGFHGEAGAADIAHHLPHLDAGTDRRVEFLRVGLEIGRHLVLAGETVGIDVEFHSREAVVPGRAVGHQ
ncbi:Uncharacterised protein [Pseudomonas aeruginosa]|nr:Uncharacterised protein [Pseudomonas aeruginosa]